MDRSPLQASRGLIVVLLLLVSVGLLVKLRRLSNAKVAATSDVHLDTISHDGAASPAPAASDAPAPATPAPKPAFAPIQTSTTDLLSGTLGSHAQGADNRTLTDKSTSGSSVGAGHGAAWSQLLTTGTLPPVNAGAIPESGAIPAAAVTNVDPLGGVGGQASAPQPDNSSSIHTGPSLLGAVGHPSTPVVTGNGPIADAQAYFAAGQLVEARQVLNDALQSNQRTPDAAVGVKSQMAQLNQTLVFSPKVFANDPFGGSHIVARGEALTRIAASYGTTWELLARINDVDPRHLRAGATIKVVRGPFFAVVDKKAFTMDVYLGALPGSKDSMYCMTFNVGLGRDDSTPTGTWAIESHAKLKHPNYYPPEGGKMIGADDPANPLGGYWIALTGVDGQAVGKRSYGVHGTIDPASIGHQSSMGCIRLRNDDIALVFELMVEGKSKVVVTE